MQFQLLLPEELLYEGEIDLISGRSAEGSFGILDRHQPILMELETAPIKIDTPRGKKYFAVYGGYLRKDRDDNVVIMTPEAKSVEEIDKSETEETIEQLEQQLEEVGSGKGEQARQGETEKAELQKALTEARADLAVVERG